MYELQGELKPENPGGTKHGGKETPKETNQELAVAAPYDHSRLEHDSNVKICFTRRH